MIKINKLLILETRDVKDHRKIDTRWDIDTLEVTDFSIDLDEISNAWTVIFLDDDHRIRVFKDRFGDFNRRDVVNIFIKEKAPIRYMDIELTAKAWS